MRQPPVFAATIMLLLAGCSLVDQTTFAPSPEAPPPAAAIARPAPALDPRPPLVTVDYATPTPNYRDLLAYAVRAAEARSRAVQYDVVSVVAKDADTTEGTERALAITRAIMAERVPASRLHMGLRVDPAVANSQVRVYVR